MDARDYTALLSEINSVPKDLQDQLPSPETIVRLPEAL